MSACVLPVVLRPMGKDDENFVVKTFIESAAMAHSWAGIGHFADRWHNKYLGIVRNSRVLVAAFSEDTSHILGFAIGNDAAIVFAYVRPGQREMGLGRLMVEALGFTAGPLRVGVWTKIAEKICDKHVLLFSPYLCGTGFEGHGQKKALPSSADATVPGPRAAHQHVKAG